MNQGNKRKFTDFAVGIILAICLFFFLQWIYIKYDEYKQSAPITDWVEVSRLVVPDFKVGVDPSILYDREVKQAVSLNWTSEMRHFTNDSDYEIVCTAVGFSELEPSRAIPKDGYKLSTFSGKSCSLPAGTYRLYVAWQLKPFGTVRSVDYNFSSNIFEVIE